MLTAGMAGTWLFEGGAEGLINSKEMVVLPPTHSRFDDDDGDGGGDSDDDDGGGGVGDGDGDDSDDDDDDKDDTRCTETRCRDIICGLSQGRER